MSVSSRLKANNMSNQQLDEAHMIPSSISTEYDVKPEIPIRFKQDSSNITSNCFFFAGIVSASD